MQGVNLKIIFFPIAVKLLLIIFNLLRKMIQQNADHSVLSIAQVKTAVFAYLAEL